MCFFLYMYVYLQKYSNIKNKLSENQCECTRVRVCVCVGRCTSVYICFLIHIPIETIKKTFILFFFF